MVAAVGAAWLAHAAELTLSVDDVESPSFSARAVRARLSGNAWKELTLDVGRVTVAGREWRNLKLTCADLDSRGGRVSCSTGVLQAGEKIPLSFTYVTATREFVVEAKLE